MSAPTEAPAAPVGGVLVYDDQSVLAAFAAEQLHARAPAAFSLLRAQQAGRLPGEPLRWEEAGRSVGGVEAVLHALAAGGSGALQRYRRSALWRRVYGAGYRWAEGNRTTALWLLRRLTRPRDGYAVSAWLFLRLLALTFFIAFASLGVQVLGLFGSEGIVPLGALLERARGGYSGVPWLAAPSLLWVSASDGALVGLTLAGALLSLLLFAGVFPRLLLGCLLVLYLSFSNLGAPFLSFQWDILLLETGFLALFLAPRGLWVPWPAGEPPRLARWLLKWLLFRLMWSSGMVKLTSGDPSWRQFTALEFHLWTQPLPSVAAWWMARWGPGVLRLETALTLVIELVFPFLLFAHRPLRRIAVLGFLTLLLAIAVTGSYGFLGLLTASLCLLALEDDALRWLKLRRRTAPSVPRRWLRLMGALVLSWVFVASVAATWARLRRSWQMPTPLRIAHAFTRPLSIANGYGMFEVMTKERDELSLEGSEDGETWRPYRFRYKPGAPDARPRYAAPHMPRLDWMMWFAALGDCQNSPWLFSLQQQLLVGSRPVAGLFEELPFERPPKQLRVLAAPYRFDASGAAWWTVGAPAAFCPAVTLREGQLERVVPQP